MNEGLTGYEDLEQHEVKQFMTEFAFLGELFL